MEENEDLLGHIIFTKSSSPGIDVFLYNKEHGYLILVDTPKRLAAFGFYTAGPELGTLQISDYKGTYEDRIKATVEILSESYDKAIKDVKYWDIKDFMNNHELPTKKMSTSFKYVFDYLKEEYQRLWKFAEKEATKDDLKDGK